MLYNGTLGFPELLMVTSEIGWGKMASSTNSDPEKNANNQKFFDYYGIEREWVVMGGLIHNSHAVYIGESDIENKRVPNTDALISCHRLKIGLAFASADCQPIFLFSKKVKAIGIVHVGWQSLTGRFAASSKIIPKTLELARVCLKCDINEIEVLIGPSIRKCCFTVLDDERGLQNFKEYGNFVSKNEDGKRYNVDLVGITKKQLSESGVEKIHDSKICTYCSVDSRGAPKYHSRRREGKNYGLNLNLIWMKP